MAPSILLLGCAGNLPPELSGGSLELLAGHSAELRFRAEDPEGQELALAISAERGSIEQGRYRAPHEPGGDRVLVEADDGEGGRSALWIAVAVLDPLQFSEPRVLSEGEGNARLPSAAFFQGELHLAWHDFSTEPASVVHAHGEEVERLELVEGKAIRPLLLADETLELWFESEGEVFQASWEGSWTGARSLGPGEQVAAALGPEGPEAAWFVDGEPSWWGEPLPVEAPYVDSLRLALAGSPEGLELGLLLSPGESSYDLNRLRWSPETGWSAPELLHESPSLGAASPVAATTPEGEVIFAWTEQDPDDVWSFGVAVHDGAFRWVSRQEGAAAWPALAAPEGGALVAWVDAESALWISREPFDEARVLAEHASEPRLALDDEGFAHLVWVQRESAAEPYRVHHASNRPPPRD